MTKQPRQLSLKRRAKIDVCPNFRQQEPKTSPHIAQPSYTALSRSATRTGQSKRRNIIQEAATTITAYKRLDIQEVELE